MSNLKHLVIFFHCLVNGKLQTHYLKMVDINNGKAETIEGKLLDVCRECEIQFNTIFGFGSDGASVMTGCHGVVVCLKNQNPEINCGAHRLVLASSQAAHSIPYLKRFDGHLNTSFITLIIALYKRLHFTRYRLY